MNNFLFIGLLLLILGAFLLIDFLSSLAGLARINKEFYSAHNQKPRLTTIGSGPEINLAIVGDSTFDGAPDAKLQFGPAQVLINKLAKHKKVNVHMFAQAGARSTDVVDKQLPDLKQLPSVDYIFVYMGANNVIRFKDPKQVAKDYSALLEVAEDKSSLVIASAIANYWHIKVFSIAHRLWLYYAVNVANRKIGKLAKKHKNFIFVSVKKMHRKYKSNKYLADGFHPGDKINQIWGEYIIEHAFANPRSASFLSKIK